MNLLDQTFTALRYNGEFVDILDICQLIKDLGARRFLSRFGKDHNIMPYGQAQNERGSSWWNDIFTYKGDLSYEFEFVILNGKGNVVQPMDLLHAFYDRYPKLIDLREKRRLHSGKWVNKCIGYRRANDHRCLKQFHGVVAEDGEPKMKRNFLFTPPYDDDYENIGQRSWKVYRKTQYKQK